VPFRSPEGFAFRVVAVRAIPCRGGPCDGARRLQPSGRNAASERGLTPWFTIDYAAVSMFAVHHHAHHSHHGHRPEGVW